MIQLGWSCHLRNARTFFEACDICLPHDPGIVNVRRVVWYREWKLHAKYIHDFGILAVDSEGDPAIQDIYEAAKPRFLEAELRLHKEHCWPTGPGSDLLVIASQEEGRLEPKITKPVMLRQTTL